MKETNAIINFDIELHCTKVVDCNAWVDPEMVKYIGYTLVGSAFEMRVTHYSKTSLIKLIEDEVEVFHWIKFVEIFENKILFSTERDFNREIVNIMVELNDIDSVNDIRKLYIKDYGINVWIKPNASLYNPCPDYLNVLIRNTGLSKKEIAEKVGMTERGLAFNVMDQYSKNYRRANYALQFSIECLALKVSHDHKIMIFIE